ncbi:MAG: 4-hydroxy-tetrahydrodipicolinate synthase [Spirochaetaceae bacterium]|jgi:4-hydroxy-tetrahydrodipicolinate synthase|nr:4-hydroxy-tetrahydrodipicolinate synthase [Spirochaetaceae bacterium]
MIKLEGAFTALITPMTASGQVDFDGYLRLLRFQMDEGIDGLLPIGTTGETPTLDEDEEEELIRLAVREAGGRLPVIAGAGSNSTRDAVRYTERAKRLGADGALVVTPYYNKPNDSGLVKHFAAVAEVGLPIVVYNIAGRTGRNIPTPLLAKIACIPGIAGVKEASGDINQMDEVIRTITLKKRAGGGDFAVFSGDDALTLPLAALGGAGVISVVSNLLPKRVQRLVALCLGGDFAEARKLHSEMMPFVHAAFIETNPVPIKYALSLAGLPSGPTRLPLGPLSPESKRVVEAAVAALHLPCASTAPLL